MRATIAPITPIFIPKDVRIFKVNKDAYYFNCYDGVLMKKDVIPYFNHCRFKILDHFVQDGINHSLLAEDGIKINNDLYSDHLPIIFELDFTKENHGSDPRAS